MHSKNLNKKDFVNGLYVEGGRLINDRPNSMTGIQKAASIKRSVKNDRKVNQIAEAIELAEDKKSFRQLQKYVCWITDQQRKSIEFDRCL